MKRRNFLKGLIAAPVITKVVAAPSDGKSLYSIPHPDTDSYLTDSDSWFLSEESMEAAVLEFSKKGPLTIEPKSVWVQQYEAEMDRAFRSLSSK